LAWHDLCLQTLGLGSAGTVVYEGELDGRRVAVKRLLSQFYDLARKELDTLVRSDDHPNIVRCFALEEDREFVYLALELCSSSLADLVERNQSAELVTFTGHPTELAMSIAQNVVAGLSTLHNRGIVHRDLKPANVLMTDGNVAKVSDMGLCKRLVEEQSSFESIGAGGSSGWQAPEQLKQRLPGAPPIGRQTKSIDVFSLGCVLYYCFTGGRHPFGDERFARDGNIITGSVNLSGLVLLPLHKHVVSCMLLQVGPHAASWVICSHGMRLEELYVTRIRSCSA
jgi:serine/threonine-protein kinase/endoribonuclease IRE1